MFLFLFASVAVALLVFLMKPDADRIGLGVGAFFSAVASSYITTAELPGAGIITLCDLINILGMITVFLTIMSSVIIKHFAVDDNNLPLAKAINRISMLLFLFGYIISNIVLAQMASA